MTKLQADIERRRLIQVIVSGFTYDPGHSDLDDCQPIHVRMTLGEYRAACKVNAEVERAGEQEASNDLKAKS
jgi:hypothetical protein